MRRRHAPQYRHTAAFSAGPEPGAWQGDVTLIYSVYWGCKPDLTDPGSGPEILDWSIVAVDRVPVGFRKADPSLIKLVDEKLEELTPDLLRAAEDTDDYAAEAYHEERREELRTTGVVW